MILNKKFCKPTLILSILFFSLACQNQTVKSQNYSELLLQAAPKTLESPAQRSQTDHKNILSIEDIVSKRKYLKYEGYEIKKSLTKKKYNYDSLVAGISNVVLQKNGKTILKFEGGYYPTGNLLDFGLFSFLGDKTKQLVIYDTSNRYGRVWIVSLSPTPRILFDSADWKDFREFVYIADIDKDGTYEISLQGEETLTFNDNRIAHVNIPQIGIDFKYDRTEAKFLPANHKFQNLYLEKIKEGTSNVTPQNKADGFDERTIGNFIRVFLTYIYAGRENEAWKFFDKSYHLEDKESRKDKIKTLLIEDPIYRFIQNDMNKDFIE